MIPRAVHDRDVQRIVRGEVPNRCVRGAVGESYLIQRLVGRDDDRKGVRRGLLSSDQRRGDAVPTDVYLVLLVVDTADVIGGDVGPGACGTFFR